MGSGLRRVKVKSKMKNIQKADGLYRGYVSMCGGAIMGV